ncbi:hypothetical protein K490DRAFT_74565 [Saccharata proteae CBS 121410]|uniref:ASST-domain-containing protein n=1 Tax=Saccharata proteae CBS 121410 TaxID=1314787 RepID=A0A9P4HW46_9PEZI|nr:hypothetical protein K490DRAFT_74565 [Saccharata proteae CBS 121410]
MSPFAPSLSCAAAFLKKSLFLLPFITGALADLDNFTSPTYFFHTRPELHAPILHFDILYPQLVSPGYIFVAPYRNIDPGPYIYDNHGELVWSGAGLTGPHTSHAPKVCEYKGKDHLCFFQGEQFQGFARGHGVIMDETYSTVKTVESGGATPTGDMHEYRLIEGGKSALITIYQTRQYDLAPYGIEGGMGWIVDSVFQEVDVDTGAVNFEWRALDHISPSFTYTMAATTDTSGDGLTPGSPWDYFHINSIDKNADGDYLISARHTAAVYKLSGKDGSVMWELNGANPTFQNINLHFSSQHHARWRKENGTHTVLTLFDNASNNFNITNPCSRGMQIAIDHVTNTATMTREWLAPEENCLLAGSQGNMQTLDDGHVFIGWGDKPYFSEHLATGEAVSYGKIAQPESGVMNYRASKFQWKGTPVDNPALFTYSRTGTNVAGMALYVSWNGATEVRKWDFYGSHSAEGPWERLATATKTGFETMLRIPDVKMFTYAEAVDAGGRVLRRSAVTKTFVPSAALMAACDDYGCMQQGPLGDGHIENKVPYVANGGAQALPKTMGSFLASIGGPLLIAMAILVTLAVCLYKHRARKGMSRARRTVSQTAVSLQEMMVPQGARQQWMGKRYARVEGDAEAGS